MPATPPMPNVTFQEPAQPAEGAVLLLTGDGPELSAMGKALDEALGGQLTRAAKAAEFEGKPGKSLEVLAPGNGDIARVFLLGVGEIEAEDENAWIKLGGEIAGAGLPGEGDLTVLAELGADSVTPEQAAAIGAGIRLRSYSFEKYKTKKNGKKPAKKKARSVKILVGGSKAAKKAYARSNAIVSGVTLARDLVNEPANALGPEEFAAEAQKLEELGVTVTVLDEAAMKKEGMNALLAVGQGSGRPSRLVTMEWKGVKKKSAPVCFIGKGVVFDTGGISIKPAAGMEDMKGDMGGAAAVIGAMKALATRKAKANVVGIMGLVENMPDGLAQRPGDIVTAMSGQTIEVINTDAEGRLVLADALTYAQKMFKPAAIVDLATLTGAIIVALGHQNAGVFSNEDAFAAKIVEAGKKTGDLAWHMPLSSEYDKLIDSRFADMKNTGGRWAGAVTAAQFLHRFVENGTTWAHMDVAGTAFSSPANELNQGWASGYGVRLLDRLVADHYEG